MYKTSRKSESAFSRRGRDIINSRRANRIADQQRQLSIKQNELDIAQLYLIENLSSDMIEEGTGEYFLVGKYLEMYFGNPDTKEYIQLSEQDIQEIDSRIPEGERKVRFKQHGINPTLRKILYYTLVLTIIAALVVPADARHKGHSGRNRLRREKEARQRRHARQKRLNGKK
jgi:hypothetical protein